MTDTPCFGGHTWTHQFGEDWTPEQGTPCDCGKKLWGIPLTKAREHEWQFYANGTFCRRCGEPIGTKGTCR